MKKILILSFYVFSIALISCSGGSDGGGDGGGGGGGPVDPPGPVAPSAATLSKPANNSECLEVDAVKFEWNKSLNTDTYTIMVTNLISKTTAVLFSSLIESSNSLSSFLYFFLIIIFNYLLFGSYF